MMKWLVAVLLLMSISLVKAQDHDWAFGFYGDVQLQRPDYLGTFGIQGKYDFAAYHAGQLTVNGRKDYVSVSADYLLNFLDRYDSNFNVFGGVGVGQDFYRRAVATEDGNLDVLREDFENYTMLAAQVGLSYYVPDIALSLYTGYKYRTDIEFNESQPHIIMIGLRYHLW